MDSGNRTLSLKIIININWFMSKKYLILATIGLISLTAGSVLAHDWNGFGNSDPEQTAKHQQAMFEREANMFGISVESIKDYWAEGKTMKEIMEEVGISQEDLEAKMEQNRIQEMKSFVQILVDQGVITQDQADKRLDSFQNQPDRVPMNRNMGRGRMGFER